jgi:hypothetical protein
VIECSGEAAMPLISSSFDPRGVEVYRKRLFGTLAAERGRVDLQLLMDFHACHAPIPSAYSPCMHRDNALTVSFSKVTVADGVIEFVYFPVPPCARREREVTTDTLSKWKLEQPSVHLRETQAVEVTASTNCYSPYIRPSAKPIRRPNLARPLILLPERRQATIRKSSPRFDLDFTRAYQHSGQKMK